MVRYHSFSISNLKQASAGQLPVSHLIEGDIDVIQFETRRNQIVQFQFSCSVKADKSWNIFGGMRITSVGSRQHPAEMKAQ